MNIGTIEKNIRELEHSDTTFSNCEKLAHLYIVKQFYENVGMRTVEDEYPGTVKQELSDVFPYYEKYCRLKREYQLNHTEKEEVLNALEAVCEEIREFLGTLYSSTDMPEERHLIVRKLSNIPF